MKRTSDTPEALTMPGSTYRIRVAGVLGEEWSKRVGGMAITVRAESSGEKTTELLGALPDQAALMGVLDLLYTRGVRLLGIECLAEDGRTFEPKTVEEPDR